MIAQLNNPGVDFNTHKDKLFSQIYFKLKRVNTRFTVLYGGASSGKSYAAHQYELITIMKPGKGDTLVMRKHASDLRESCYKLFIQLIAKYNIQHLFRTTYGGDRRSITCLHTGRSIVFKGIDEPEKLKSIVGIQRIVLEEANQFEIEDFLELNRRARGIENIHILLILNPISENHWIKTKICDAGSSYYADTSLIKTTYKDNCNLNGKSFLTDKDIEQLENLKAINENHYRIYVLGDWGVDNTELKFCWAFSSSNIVKTERVKEDIHWISFDFNVNPLTCTIAQVFAEEKTLRCIECIKLENSDIWKMCDRINASYPDVIWMVTGDATGQSRNAMVADNMNYFMIIQQQLQITDQQLQVPSINPRIEENRLLVNAVLKNWTVEMHPELCAPLIYDCQYVEVDGKGAIIKDRSSSEKFADFLDNFRYLINIAVRPHFAFLQR